MRPIPATSHQCTAAKWISQHFSINFARPWAIEPLRRDKILPYVNDNTPVIVQISWMGGGGHFAVCAYVYKTDQRCIFLDPWYGLVERAGSTLPAYTIGTPEFGTTPGKLNGWILVTRQ